METYKLEVLITGDWVERMKRMKYALCVAKKVNSCYSVVWTSTRDYNYENEYSWTDDYQVGAVQGFEAGQDLIKLPATKKQHISFGQTVVREPNGVLKAATGAPNGESFIVANMGGETHIVVDQMIGANFQTTWVDPDGTINGKVKVTPQLKVLVFFEKDITTGTMFVEVNYPAIEIDFTGTARQTVAFVESKSIEKAGVWVQGGGDNFAEPVQTSYSVRNGFQPLAGGYTYTGDVTEDEGSPE
ncbi:hypothetical protein EXIGLDRAFT_776506 [Exidia glandulosa HHB12029]|uniref:Uncharacterized protein n=1 Tax=Exidia glandulosa HHB12029 TaxID=1314781 RepID=A0A165DG74_EXIGL|nr:hypothetical protein EXIGLDRAFT_776506 [Exidia glandulosa HHB12029]